MAYQKIKYPTGTTPRGVAVFPYLVEPDDKFDKVQFKVNLALPVALGADLVGRIDAMMEALQAQDPKVAALLPEEEAKRLNAKTKKLKPSDLPYGPRTDKEGNMDETTTVFKFKKNGNFKDQKTGETKPTFLPLFDAKGKVLVVEDIWGGSEIKVAYELRPWVNAKSEYGVKLAMTAVQVLELRQGGGAAASDFGFANEAPEDDAASPAMPEADDADGDF